MTTSSGSNKEFEALPSGLAALPLARADAAALERLYREICKAVRPRDFIEELWAGDIAYSVWEARSLQRRKAWLLKRAQCRALSKILIPIIADIAEKLVNEWACERPEAVAEVDRILIGAGVNFESVAAEAFLQALPYIEPFERLLDINLLRRNNTLREIDRRRATFAVVLRKTFEQTEVDGKSISEAEPPPIGVTASASASQ